MDKNNKDFKALLAFKVIGLVEGLSSIDWRVAAAIFDHLNKRTGQCDPSVARIARLLSISERAVIRATNKCERVGLLIKIQHGGNLLRNQYIFNWAFIETSEEEWKSLKRSLSRKNLTPHQRQNVPEGPVKSVHQTCPTNLSEETFLHETLKPSSETLRGLSNNSVRYRGIDKSEAMELAARKRWFTDLNQRFANDMRTNASIVSRLSSELDDEATKAEIAEKGAGMKLVCLRLGVEL
jgi:predicted transcriptional regulator